MSCNDFYPKERRWWGRVYGEEIRLVLFTTACMAASFVMGVVIGVTY